MKRIAIFFFVACLCLSMTCVKAEGVSLSDLLSLYQSYAEFETEAKGKKEDVLTWMYMLGYDKEADALAEYRTLKPGVYKVGEDIDAGTYRFMYDENSGWMTKISIGTELNASGKGLTYARQSFELWDPYSMSYYFQLTEAYFRLKDGDYVVVEYSDVRVQPMEKQLSW